ncbi:MAG: hypothetical protein MR597_06180, partial [Bacteroidales bacterium]|nr:hypothetical protein [Bacteroidales bacterium]
AYSLIYWIQNMGMLLVPVAVGFIFRNTESGKLAALHSEYVFLALCVLAIAVSLLYARSSDRNPDLGLDRANR